MVGCHSHYAYGIATYAKSSIENISLVEVKDDNDIYLVTIVIAGLKVVNVYKPPNVTWPQVVLPNYEHPTIYIGDFNSHHSMWKYQTNDDNGVRLVDWADTNDLNLIFDAKDQGTFHSGRWKRDYNPDLCFVTTTSELQPLPIQRRVLTDFPHSQHRPVVCETGIKIPIINSIPRARWNFNKANWVKFAAALDSNIRWIEPITKNYKKFVDIVISTAKKHIPRGYRKEYIPGWSRESDRLLKTFLQNGEPDIADSLLRSLDKSRLEKWTKTTKNMDFTHSSRKAWSLLRKLGGSGNLPSNKPRINPNLISNRIVETSKVKSDKSQTSKVKRDLAKLKATTHISPEFSKPFTMS